MVVGRGYESEELGLALVNENTDKIRLPLKGNEDEHLKLFQSSCKKLNGELVDSQFCSLEQNLQQPTKVYATKYSEMDFFDIEYDKAKGKEYYGSMCKEYFGGRVFENQGGLFCGFTSPTGSAVFEYSSSKCSGLSSKTCDRFFQRMCDTMNGHTNDYGHNEKCEFDLNNARPGLRALSA